jgi:putative tryptophan/tyrosine transport system substrate-binding protein
VKRLILLVLLGLLVGSLGAIASAAPIKIGITQIVEHPALDAVRQGVIDTLAAAGYVDGENVDFLVANAQGDMGTALAIAQNFKAEGVDLVVAIATPTAQAAAQVFEGTDTPIVFAAVTDPVSAGLVKSATDPSGNANITGASDLIDVASDLALLKAVSPSIKRIGMVYNPGETNSDVLTKQAIKAAGPLGLTIVEAVADTSANVPMAAQSLAGRVDAFYVTTDNTVVSAIDSVFAASKQAKVPFLMADPTSIASATLATGFDYYKQGELAGGLVLDILGGEAPNEIPVAFQHDPEVHLNLDAAAAIGFTFPQAVIDKASSILFAGSTWERATSE